MVGLDAKRRCELEQGIDARNARPTLQQANLRAMQLGPEPELFLRKPGLLALVDEVRAEPLRDRHDEVRRSK
jgi:hypothetical protein